jgi:hypothetical protein
MYYLIIIISICASFTFPDDIERAVTIQVGVFITKHSCRDNNKDVKKNFFLL